MSFAGASTDGGSPTDATSAKESSDGGADVVDPPIAARCNPAADPKDSPLCLTNTYGVFVNGTTGADTSAGTKEAPLKTIGAAIAKASTATQKRVYVCEGTYAEHLVLDAAHDGISVYGGWSCADWHYTGTQAKVAPNDAGYALKVDGAASAVTIADLDMTAIAATGQDTSGVGNSSIAAFVNASTGVTLRRVALTAGNGSNGANGGTPPTNLFSTNIADLQGSLGSGATGGLARTCACKIYGSSTGGKGGDGKAPQADPGLVGLASPAATPLGIRDSTGGAGENGGGSCTGGHSGPDGSARASGTAAAIYGVLTSLGWTPSSGTDGQAGNPGGGGGGGGGGLTDGAGGGGCGGCGGAAGRGGKGGGASVALLVRDTAVTLEHCALRSGDAGEGGNGSTGEGGGGGGGGNIGACSGGRGGNGAGGGGGAGGTGGVSLAIGYVGPTPAVDGATTVTSGTPGAGGNFGGGGAGGTNVLGTAPTGSPGAPGKPGIAQAAPLAL